MIAQNPAAAGRPAAATLRPEGTAEAPHPATGEDQPARGEDFAALLAAAPKHPRARPSIEIEAEVDPMAPPAPGADRAVSATPPAPSPAAELVAAPSAPTPAEPPTDAASPLAPSILPSQPLAKAALANATPPAGEGTTAGEAGRPAAVAPEMPEPKAPHAPRGVTAAPPVADVPPGREEQAALPEPGAAPAATPALRPGPAPAEASGGSPVPPAASPTSTAASLALQPDAPAGWHLVRSPGHPSTEPAAHPAVSTSSPSATVTQVAVAVARATEHRVEIRLDPPELGRVQIHLTPVDGGVQAVVLADRPETQDLLRRHAHALMQELGDAGFGNVSLDFAAGQNAAPDPGPRRPPPAVESVALAMPEPTAATPTARRPAAASGLDVRL